jgi:hypothetical protein
MSIFRENKKLLDEVRDMLQFYHYLIHTERIYCDWIKRYIQYYTNTHREEELLNEESKTEAFLTLLIVDKEVSSSRQNQVMNALAFLYPFPVA